MIIISKEIIENSQYYCYWIYHPFETKMPRWLSPCVKLRKQKRYDALRHFELRKYRPAIGYRKLDTLKTILVIRWRFYGK